MRARLAVLAAVLFVAACAAAPQEEPPDVRGTITTLTVDAGGAESGTILVEENPAEPSGSAKDVVAVGASTLVLRRTAQGVIAAGFFDMEPGQRVVAWYTGPVLESYPRRARATRVEILND
ncbi:MAG TPA: DUF3221 domain-containing protein [Thermoanaerobaculia bacterium]|nr:DUF3221 domain-containing protein [Thermoanaerobaculia bacterium]